jgi:hypothetical protein
MLLLFVRLCEVPEVWQTSDRFFLQALTRYRSSRIQVRCQTNLSPIDLVWYPWSVRGSRPTCGRQGFVISLLRVGRKLKRTDDRIAVVTKVATTVWLLCTWMSSARETIQCLWLQHTWMWYHQTMWAHLAPREFHVHDPENIAARRSGWSGRSGHGSTET